MAADRRVRSDLEAAAGISGKDFDRLDGMVETGFGLRSGCFPLIMYTEAGP